jgi:SAM-dependent methyltransferase
MANDNNREIIADYYTKLDCSWQDLDGEIRERSLNSFLPLLKSIAKQVPSGLAIDVGCGGGSYTQLLPNLFKKVMGCDLTERLINEARKRFHEIQFETTDASHLLTSDSSADFVMSVGLVEHLEKTALDSHFTEMARVLKSQGMVLFRVWSKYSVSGLMVHSGRMIDNCYLAKYFYSRVYVRNELHRKGFKNVKFYGCLLIARWWGSNNFFGKLLWSEPVKKVILFLESHLRSLPVYDTYWVVATKQ